MRGYKLQCAHSNRHPQLSRDKYYVIRMSITYVWLSARSANFRTPEALEQLTGLAGSQGTRIQSNKMLAYIFKDMEVVAGIQTVLQDTAPETVTKAGYIIKSCIEKTSTSSHPRAPYE